MAAIMNVDGNLIRQDREDVGLSRLAMLAKTEELTGFKLSESTLRRAENGFASRSSLKWIAEVLGHPPQRYACKPKGIEPKSVLDLEGTWRVFYLEDDSGIPPYLVTEKLHVAQNGTGLTGVYEPFESDHPDGYLGSASFRMEGHVAETFVLGRYFKDAASFQQGAGVFQLLLLRSATWAEGVCTFFADDGQIMAGLNIWIREDSTQFALMVKQAKRVMDGNKTLLRFPASTSLRSPAN